MVSCVSSLACAPNPKDAVKKKEAKCPVRKKGVVLASRVYKPKIWSEPVILLSQLNGLVEFAISGFSDPTQFFLKFSIVG